MYTQGDVGTRGGLILELEGRYKSHGKVGIKAMKVGSNGSLCREVQEVTLGQPAV